MFCQMTCKIAQKTPNKCDHSESYHEEKKKKKKDYSSISEQPAEHVHTLNTNFFTLSPCCLVNNSMFFPFALIRQKAAINLFFFF